MTTVDGGTEMNGAKVAAQTDSGKTQPPTVYTAEEFEPEVVRIPAPRIYTAEDFDPEVIEIARPSAATRSPESPAFYGDVLNYPGVLDYGGESATPTTVQSTQREDAAKPDGAPDIEDSGGTVERPIAETRGTPSPTVYTEEEFEPEVVRIRAPTIYTADDFDPAIIELARAKTLTKKRETASFYGGVLDYPEALDYGEESAMPPTVQSTQREDAQAGKEEEAVRGLRKAATARLPRFARHSRPEEELSQLIEAAKTAWQVDNLLEWEEIGGSVSAGALYGQAMLKLLAGFGEAREEGDSLAAINAHRSAFARTLEALASGTDWPAADGQLLPEFTEVGQRQRAGRNDAIRLIKGLGDQAGEDAARAYLRKYQGKDGFARALSDIGGLASSLPHEPPAVSELISAASATWEAGALGDAWAAMSPAVSAGAIYAQLIVKVMEKVGEANVVGDTLAARNAHKSAFARTLEAAANGTDWPTADGQLLPENTQVGYRQRTGRNDAIRFIKGLAAKVGEDGTRAFLRRYEGRDGFARVLTDLGGLEVSLPKTQ